MSTASWDRWGSYDRAAVRRRPRWERGANARIRPGAPRAGLVAFLGSPGKSILCRPDGRGRTDATSYLLRADRPGMLQGTPLMLNAPRTGHFRPTPRQAHGLGDVQVAGDGGSAPAERFQMSRTNALNAIGQFTSGSGQTTCVYTMASNNAALIRRSVSNAMAALVSGVSGADLRSGRVSIDQSALSAEDRERIAKSAAEKFFAAAKLQGGENAEILTAESTQRPPASYCVPEDK